MPCAPARRARRVREQDRTDSLEAVKQRGRHDRPRVGRDAAAQVGRRVARPLPVPRGADALVLGRSGEEGLLLLRLPGVRATRSGSSARPRRWTSRPRWSGWPTATASSSSTRSEPAGGRSRRARARPPAASCWTTPPTSTRGSCGTPPRPRRPAPTWPSAASPTRPPAVPGRLRARRRADRVCVRGRSARDSPPPSWMRPGSRCGRAAATASASA